MSRRHLALAALFAAMAAGLFVRLGSDRLYPKSEKRCFEVVGTLVESGDWLVPRFGGQMRLQKPPLFYWVAAAFAEISGAHTPFTLRLASALSALALAAAVFGVGRSLGGFDAGLCSVAVLGSCALFYIRGRIGDAEMLLALLVFTSLAAFERLWSTGDRRMAPALAVLVGLGFLTKATAALLGVLAPILAWLALKRSLHVVLRPSTLAWSAVAALIGLSWYGLVFARVPGAAELFRQFLLAPFGVRPAHYDETHHHDSTHVRSLFYYLPRFPLQTLPAGVLLLWLGFDGWRERLWRSDPRLSFWAVAFLAQLVAWSLVPGKQLHYLLALVPVFAVIAGRRLALRFSPRA